MLYPIAPEKIEEFKTQLNFASDAENIPRPTFSPIEGTPSEILEVISKYVEDSELVDPAEGFPVIQYRGWRFAVIEVTWPSPLRTTSGELLLHVRTAPVGPDPTVMWQVLYILPERES